MFSKGEQRWGSAEARLVNASSPHLDLCPASSLLTVPQMPLGPCPSSTPVLFQELGAGLHPQWGPAPSGSHLVSPPVQPWSGCQSPPPPTPTPTVLPEDWTLSGAIANPSQLAQTRGGREHELNINEADFLTRLLTLHLETEMAAGRARTTNLRVNAQRTSCLAMSRDPRTLPKPRDSEPGQNPSSRRSTHVSAPDSQGDSWPGSLERRAASPGSRADSPCRWTPQICPGCGSRPLAPPRRCPGATGPVPVSPERCTLGPERCPVGDRKGAVNKVSKDTLAVRGWQAPTLAAAGPTSSPASCLPARHERGLRPQREVLGAPCLAQKSLASSPPGSRLSL